MPINTGYKGYAKRRRLINGVPDGYVEDNTPGPNYVPPMYDPDSCPIPEDEGTITVLLNHPLLQLAKLYVKDASTDEDIYIANMVSGGTTTSSVITVPGVITKAYKLVLDTVLINENSNFAIRASDEDKGSGVTNFELLGAGNVTGLDMGDYNTNISIVITLD